MFCRNCGNKMDDMADVCVACGSKRNKGKNYCPNCGEKTNAQADYCIKCGVKLNNVLNLNSIEGTNGEKSKILAGLLGIFFGALGVHRFYLGYIGIGLVQLILTFITCGISSLWGFIEGILILCDTGITEDANGKPLV